MPTLLPPVSTCKLPLWALVGLCGLLGVTASRADEVTEVQRMYYAGQASAAMQRADDYLASHPKDARVRFLKGVMLADSKRDAEAIGIFQKLSEDYPDLAEPYNNLAALYAAAGDYNRARVSLEQALRSDPTYAVAQENLGDVYAALAAQSYARTLTLDPGNVSAPPKLALARQIVQQAGSNTSSAGLNPMKYDAPPARSTPPTPSGSPP